MNYLSVCSGIEAATVAWHHMGWKPVGFSEIEKFPSQVLAHHYPQVTNFGDMTKYKEWKIDSVGLLVGGTPCQSFSVAGLRKGLSDPRGNLALTYVGILDHFRPKWFIWENVPGVLSSNQGRDFAAFLTSLGIIGYGWSYRVLDAQYFGVAQRRRRVFVVGCLGDWRPTSEVLFESDCLRRDTKKGREKREEIARCLTTGIGTRLDGETDTFVTQIAYEWHNQDSRIKPVDVAATLNCNAGGREGHLVQKVYENHPSDSRVKDMGDVCQTVTSSWGTGGGNIPFVQSFGWQNSASQSMSVDNISPTLDKSKTPAIMQNVISWDAELNPNINKMGTLIRGGQGGRTEGVAIPYDLYQITSPLNGQRRQDGDPCHTLARDNAAHASITNGLMVRRLTPKECERLQGFPDGYTDIKPNGKETPDGHRYKALGNSMAVPVMRWIGGRINSYEAMCSKAVV